MTDILTPVGRMVAGSMYKANDKDFKGNPLIIKSGPNKGQPRTEYFFALAIQKGQEQHWSQTEWGMKIYETGVQGFPNGQYQYEDFAWKVTDGDSQKPNKRGVAPCAKEGYPGHWVLSFSSSFPPNLYNADGSQRLMELDAIKNGYYIQVFGTVASNNTPDNAGVYLNHSMVALAGYGPEIHSGPDAGAVGFGGGQLPAGASATPVGGGFSPAPTQGNNFGGPTDPMAYQNQQGMPQQQQPQGMPQQQQPQGMPQQQQPQGMPQPNNGFAR